MPTIERFAYLSVYSKKNIMNHLSIMMKKSLVVLLVILTTITTIAFFAFKEPKEQVKGWFLAGDYPEGYNIGIEKSVERNKNVGFLKSVKPIKANKFGTIMQMFVPNDYLGKRVRLTGYIKSDGVKDWAGMWFRIDGGTDSKSYKALGFDNMQDRPIKGTTDWKKYEIVLDVPQESSAIAFGVLLSGPGTIWLDDLNFEIVPKDVPQTKTSFTDPNKPQNTNFAEPNN
jgi:putative transposon-encoded protein